MEQRGLSAAVILPMMSDSTGAYAADRVASLSGVPISTVHYWARTQVLVPSVSAEKIKLWSYPDLMGLRVIYWLRQTKSGGDGKEIPRSSMPTVRKALAALHELDLSLWTEDRGPVVKVDRAGRIYLTAGTGIELAATGERILSDDVVDLLRPFDTTCARGPDLYMPRPRLRIVPGKLSGSPHVVKTRIETIALAALASRGLAPASIGSLYPILDEESVNEAIDLERQLAGNLRAAA